jgi:hypothetical protein
VLWCQLAEEVEKAVARAVAPELAEASVEAVVV